MILCTQDHVAPHECVECGGGLPRGGGYRPNGPRGFRFCSEDCIASYQERAAQVDVSHHLRMRDLLCACEICAARELPSAQDRAEYAAYVASDGAA